MIGSQLKSKQTPRIVVGVTGSIAAHKAIDIVSLLNKRGCQIRVVMTADALKCVTEVPFRTLSHHSVVTDLYESNEEWTPEHISLADWADMVLIAPATANTIAKLACGLADNSLTCLMLALHPETPILIAPAMNGRMWTHDATVENIRLLTSRGIEFIGPEEGIQACGYEGKGRLSSPEEIVNRSLEILKQHGRIP